MAFSLGESLSAAWTVQDVPVTQLVDRQNEWLRDELGLWFDPFEHLDAGSDPHLYSYLVGHEAFSRLKGECPTFLFAPPGGGKSAFRVRLAHACRSEEGERRFFPIIPTLPIPDRSGKPVEEARYFAALAQAAAAELLFHLTHRAYRFFEFSQPLRQMLRSALELNLPAPLDYFLEQVEKSGSLDPLRRAFDPTAVDLPIEPFPQTLRAFCRAMREVPWAPPTRALPEERFDGIVDVLLNHLGFDGIFILVDGADAYSSRPDMVLSLIDPLLQWTPHWSNRHIWAKYFLPDDLGIPVRERITSLPDSTRVINVTWTREDLVHVLRERLRVASRGMFDSLRALGSPDLPADPEAVLAAEVSPVLPREIIYLAEQVRVEHVRNVGTYGRIGQDDLEGAIARYRRERGGDGAAQ